MHHGLAVENHEREHAEKSAVGDFKATDCGDNHTESSRLPAADTDRRAEFEGSYREHNQEYPEADPGKDPTHKGRGRLVGSGLRFILM